MRVSIPATKSQTAAVSVNPLFAVELLVDGAHGVYVPRAFAKWYLGWNVNPSNLAILRKGPKAPSYWEVWDNVLNTAKYESDGNTWTLEQNDGDLFAVCFELMTDEEKHDFDFNE